MDPPYIEPKNASVSFKGGKKRRLDEEEAAESFNSVIAPQTDDMDEEAVVEYSISQTHDTDEEEEEDTHHADEEMEDEEDTHYKDEVKDEKEEEVWSEEKQEKFEKWFIQHRQIPKDIFSIPFGVGYGAGERLVEVFEVRIVSDVKRRQKLNIHGTITLCASYGKDDIFRRTRESPEVIQPGNTCYQSNRGSLTLTGPKIAAPGYDVNSVELDLMDGRREVCQGQMIMNYYLLYKSDFDRPLTEKVEGANGFSAEVTYATLSDALVVSVEIKLAKMNLSNPIKVYGEIEASITKWCGFTSNTKTTLFKKKRKNCVRISAEGCVIPLSRSLLACPMRGALKLHLNLRSAKTHVATTNVKFKPKCFGEKEVIVESGCGPISVLFTAYPPDLHPASLTAYKDSFWKLMWPKEYQ